MMESMKESKDEGKEENLINKRTARKIDKVQENRSGILRRE
jgi:hypothetical protein